jgi:hypothetical protein
VSASTRIEELLLPYDPTPLADTVQRRKRRMIGRAISLGISVALLTGLYFWRRDDIHGGSYWVFSGVVLALSLVPFVVVLVLFLQARRELLRVPSGVAVRMGRPGVVVGRRFARWSDVDSLAVVPGGLARAERLRLRTTDGGRFEVPLDQVVVHPATLDSTARAYSAGRRGVDLSRLDN